MVSEGLKSMTSFLKTLHKLNTFDSISDPETLTSCSFCYQCFSAVHIIITTTAAGLSRDTEYKELQIYNRYNNYVEAEKH